MKKKVNCEVFITAKQFNELVENPAIVVNYEKLNGNIEMFPKIKNKQLTDLIKIFEENIMKEVCHAISK